MSNDLDFDEAASDISEQVIVIRDPQKVVTIEKWLSKLTSETRGPNELNYLKLLQHMMANNRIERPFNSPPPAGPLLPLSRYINPVPCRGRLSGKDAKLYEKWRTSNSARAAQVVEDDLDALYYEDDEDEEEPADTAGNVDDENGGRVATEIAQTDEKDANAQTAGTVASSRDIVKTSDADATRAVNSDGHLSGGGECAACCSSAKGQTAAAKKKSKRDKFDEVCDPCLDGLMGRRCRKNEKSSGFGGDYKDLLGDCALPKLTEAERKTVGPELLRVLESVNESTTLQDFYFQVSQCTCDRGALLMKSSDSMLDDFHKFVSDVFESRAEHISDGLAKEQIAASSRYAYLRNRALNRATVALDFLRQAMPTFDWKKYNVEPEVYLRRTMSRYGTSASKATAVASGDGNEDKTGGGRTATGAAGNDVPETTGAGDDEDEDDAQQSANKKLLYSLNWLRTEVSRADCDCHRLYEQRNTLTTGLAKLNADLSSLQCRSSSDVNRLKDELTVLRQRSADQSKTIDRLMETIQLAMQNKSSSKTDG